MNRQALKEILDDAVGMGPESRAAFLEEACAGNMALRQEIQCLLSAHDLAPRFLSNPTAAEAAGATAARNQQNDVAGSKIGPYKLLEKIGEGGFGTVYMAEQHEPVQRRVALKVVKPGMDSKQVIARFEAERQALAMMDHPNIARVLEAGATDAQSLLGPGRPYFVMELVRGVPITRFCDENNLTIRQRLELVIDVCHAVQHAHMKGVIHRDLKPSNVLVSRNDERPVVKVIDFGVAKATQGRLTEKTLFTEFRQLIGTPTYMSPEQAGLSDLDIDTRSDIYSLGALLYELLTGSTPFDAKSLFDSGYDEMRRIIREVEPPKPSTRLSAHSGAGTKAQRHKGTKGDDSAAHSLARTGSSDSSSADLIAGLRHTDAPTLRRQLCGDLDWIVMKCLEKDRTRRYETANGLRADVQRYLAGEPVEAAPPSRVYRLHKVLRRHRASVTAGATITLLLVGGTIVSTVFWQRSERQRETAQQRQSEAESVANMLNALLESVDSREGAVANSGLRRMLDDFARTVPEKIKDHPEVEARLRFTIGTTYLRMAEYEAAEPQLATSIEICRRVLGNDHPALAQVLAQWSLLRLHQDDYAASIDAAREALAIHRKQCCDRHPEVAAAYRLLGMTLDAAGDFEEAEATTRRALALFRENGTGDSDDVAACLGILASVAYNSSQFETAEQLWREDLELCRRIHGDRSSSVGVSLNNLGTFLCARGRAAEALPLLEEALAIDAESLGEDHPSYATRLHHLAQAQCGLGELDEAELLARRALEIYAARPEYDIPEHAHAFDVLADILAARGRVDDAQAAHEQALSIRRQRLGDEHPETQRTLIEFAEFLAKKKHDSATTETLVRQLLESSQTLDEKRPLRRAWALHHLADCLREIGNHREAQRLAVESIAIYRQRPGQARREYRHALEILTEILRAQGRIAEAVPPRREALAIWREICGPGDPAVAWTLHHLADDLRSLSKLAEAEQLAREAVAIYVANASVASAEVRNEHRHAIAVLSQTLSDAGKVEEAVSIRRQFVDRCRQLSPRDDVWLAKALAPLGLLLLEQQQYVEAEPILRECLAIRERALQPGSRDYWLLAQTQSMLGGALVGQAVTLTLSDPPRAVELFRQAEPLIVNGCEWLRSNAGNVPAPFRAERVKQAGDRVLKLYECWDIVEPNHGHAAKLAQWRRTFEIDAADFGTPTPGPSP